MEITTSWTEFKSIVGDKGLMMQYVDFGVGKQYRLWAEEGGVIYNLYLDHTTTPGTGSDEKDFTDNYKADANQPIYLGEDQVMTDLEIRDTDDHLSSITDNRGYVPKTILVENTLDVDLKLCIGGSRYDDFTVGIAACGGEQTINAGENAYFTISDYFPYMMVRVHCDTAPTSGDVNVFFERVKQ